MAAITNDAAAVDQLIASFSRTTAEIIGLAELKARLLSGRQLVIK
jgi:tyrosyl-tRNA synthetase